MHIDLVSRTLSGRKWTPVDFEYMVGNLAEGVCVLEPDDAGELRYRFVNDAYRRVRQLPSDVPLVGRPVLPTLEPAVARQAVADVEATLGSGGPMSFVGPLQLEPTLIVVEKTITPILDDGGGLSALYVVIRDVTARTTAERELQFLSRHDPLTGLHNRIGFLENLQGLIDTSSAGGVAVVAIDLSEFTGINALFGHDVADLVLVEVGRRLAHLAPDESVLSRAAADEYLVASPLAFHPDAPGELVERFVAAFAEPFVVDAVEVQMLACAGYAILDVGHEARAEEVVRWAASALGRAKAIGPGTIEEGGPPDDSALRRLNAAGQLLRAIDDDVFDLHLQPIVDVTTGAVMGAESLARWYAPDGTSIPPADFIPLAEQTGTIVRLGELLLQRLCAHVQAARGAGIGLEVSYNLSPRQLVEPGLASTLAELVNATGLRERDITIELTETAAGGDVEVLHARVRELTDAGFRVAIDDFGTGASNLLRVLRLAVHSLKIDRSFVTGIDHRVDQQAIVRHVVLLARDFGIHTVAEGVERPEELATLRDLGCDRVQGYLTGRPMPFEQLIERVRPHS